MPILIVAGLVVVAGVGWLVSRAAEPPIMRQRVNAGSDRYFADRDRSRSDSGDSAGSFDDGGDCDGGGGDSD